MWSELLIFTFGLIISCLTCTEQIQGSASLSYNYQKSKLLWLMYYALNSQGLISNSPYYLPYSSCNVSLENLVLDQLIIPLLIFFFILIICLLDIVNVVWRNSVLVTQGSERVKLHMESLLVVRKVWASHTFSIFAWGLWWDSNCV